LVLKRVRLGQVTCPSGQLVVADGGYLGGWSGEQSPAEIDPIALGIDDPKLAREIAGSVDYAVVGPQAAEAAAAFDRQKGLVLYDIPKAHVGSIAGTFAEHCQEHGFDAHLEAFSERVSHRERVRRCVAAGDGSFIVFGVPVVALGGLPTDRPLPVEATQRDYGDGDLRWQDISVQVTSQPVARSGLLGHIGVDWARFAFADADALTSWKHHRPIDGLADVAFWGLSGDEAALELGASRLPEGVFGWEGMGLEQAFERYESVETWLQGDAGRRLKIDFRPHSHHYQVMRDLRASLDEAAGIEVGGAEILFAMTSWGDGWFPAFADYDAFGELVALRVDLNPAE
jgi:hypothetical protein